MYLVKSAINSLYNAVKNKFLEQVFSQTGKKDYGEKPLWEEKDISGEQFFRLFITEDPEIKPEYLSGLANNFRHKKPKPISLKKDGETYSTEYITCADNALDAYLSFLRYSYGSLEKRLSKFLSQNLNDIDQELQNQIRQNPAKSDSVNKTKLLDYRKKISSLMYASILENTEWWFYFYGYDKHRIIEPNQDKWSLVKLLLRFNKVNDDALSVEIINTDTPEHYSYEGEVDFLGSKTEIIVINLRTVPFLARQLNIKLNVGSGDGEIFLGQYLNYESDNHIISGTVVLERIDTDEINNPEPAVHSIPIKDKYTEDIDGISRYILQYLHDKKQNFRRTPNRAGHNLEGLRKWLETRDAEDMQNNNLIGI